MEVVIGIATVVIASCTVANLLVAWAIKKSSEKHDEKTRDLYQAMVITNIASGPHEYHEALTFFKDNYKGKTKINLKLKHATPMFLKR